MQITAHPRQIVFAPIRRRLKRSANVSASGAQREIGKRWKKRITIGAINGHCLADAQAKTICWQIQRHGTCRILQHDERAVGVHQRDGSGQMQFAACHIICTRNIPDLRHVSDAVDCLQMRRPIFRCCRQSKDHRQEEENEYGKPTHRKPPKGCRWRRHLEWSETKFHLQTLMSLICELTHFISTRKTRQAVFSCSGFFLRETGGFARSVSLSCHQRRRKFMSMSAHMQPPP